MFGGDLDRRSQPLGFGFCGAPADLTLYPGGPRVGLGLWNSILATVVIEGLTYAAGLWIYLRVTRAKDGIGRWGLWSFIVVVAALYVMNIFSPPPPTERLLAIVAIPYVWLLILWAWWADGHREAR